MDQKLIDLYDDFTHSRIDRRAFMERLVTLTGSAAAGLALIRTIAANPAAAAIVAENDPRLETGKVSYPGPKGAIIAYRAVLKGGGRRPGVVVIHENRGLNRHIEDVARRFALAGFVALAVDGLSPLGGTPADEDQARDMIGKLDPADAVANFAAGVSWLAVQPDVNGRVGTVGFCWGGGPTGQVVAANPAGLTAAVVYYGRVVQDDRVPGIKVPLLLHYAGNDPNINAGIPGFRAALDKAGVAYTLHMYEGKQHAFNNDTSEARYDKAAADLAWDRTIAFFKDKLGATS